MFNAYSFSFAGESSEEHGVMLYDFGGSGQSDVAFGNKASIVEARTTNRIQPIHLGVNYHESPLEFKLVFGADRPLDRYELQDISLWLTGYQTYQWLTIDQPDLLNVEFRCLITTLTPLSHGWLPVAFEATVQCDCPYAYGLPFSETYDISGQTDVLFRNESTTRAYFKPDLSFTTDSGVTEVGIVNHSDGDREFKITGLPSGGLTFSVDGTSGIIRDESGSLNLYPGFNLNFLRLVHGDNRLTVSGDGELTISGRFLYNVAG